MPNDRNAPYWNQVEVYKKIRDATRGKIWLDLGCGRGTRDPALAPIRQSMTERLYVGVDADYESLRDSADKNRVLCDASSLPFGADAFDVVSSNMVFEHLEQPILVLREMRRVTRSGGTLLIHTSSAKHFILLAGTFISVLLPAAWYRRLVSAYTGRMEDDIFPTCYRANTIETMTSLAESAGLELAKSSFLRTPYSLPALLHWFEHGLTRILPRAVSSTLFFELRKP